MYLINGTQALKIEDMTFSDFEMIENNIEEILRQNIDMVCDDEESMLLVGQQVTNQVQARSDLIAIDQSGNLVLIELKRDKKDIERRKEPLEFQAIRYAASCATIQTTDELIQNVFAPYVEKHRSEFGYEGLSSNEVARRLLDAFLQMNHVITFNERQRIVLVASAFDEQTLSAVAWLNSNQVDISCYRMILSKVGGHMMMNPQKILPVADYEDFYISLKDRTALGKTQKRDISRRSLPKINSLLEWGVVKAGDIMVAKGRDEAATLLADGTVSTSASDEPCSLQQWLKSVFGWASVATYAFAVQQSSGKTLSELRQAYMENILTEPRDEQNTALITST